MRAQLADACVPYSSVCSYVPTALSKTGTKLQIVRAGKKLPAVVADMPFVPSKYYKVPK